MKVLVIVGGGVVQEVYSNGASVTVIDVDNEKEDKTRAEIEEMIDKAAEGLEPVIPD